MIRKFYFVLIFMLLLQIFIMSACSGLGGRGGSANISSLTGSAGSKGDDYDKSGGGTNSPDNGSSSTGNGSGKSGKGSDSTSNGSGSSSKGGSAQKSLINEAGSTVADRIMVPEGFKRVKLEAGSFAEYLRNLPLKPHGSPVKYYNGGEKSRDVYEAVIDIDVGDRDLQQCADSIIRLRAEYLYQKGLFDSIHFNFTNGFNAEYSKWRQGYRIKINGNSTSWVKQAEASNDYSSFRKYLNLVFAYAGTLSLEKEMKSIEPEDMRPGDVFIKGASPGHCIIVLDMAENTATGEKIFIAAQGYMPAQDMHILKNYENADGNPWYSVDFGDVLDTPEWQFTKYQLKRFAQ